MARIVADGHFQVPPYWPRWKLRCHVIKRSGEQCKQWAVRGMPTCKWHGSGGPRNRELGMLRYMCWVITGGPQDQPVALAASVALAVFAEAVLKQGKGSATQQMQAAMFITKMLDE